MDLIYFATTFSAAIICFITSLLLFARRKDGERSRTILAFIILFSVINYLSRFMDLYHGEIPERVISVNMLLTAIFMVTSYIMYPIEVISPGYLNFKRIMRLYTPWLILLAISVVANLAGVKYKHYNTLLQMLPNYTHFEAWFRILLAFLFFSPVIAIFIIPYTRKYNNTDKVWMRKYITIFIINTIAYIIVLSSDAVIIKTTYYVISVSCSLAIAYMEIFERLIRDQTTSPIAVIDIKNNKESIVICKENDSVKILSIKIERYINDKRLWENPDLNAYDLYRSLCTNRTTFARAIKELGYENFGSYINTLRVKEFITHIESGTYGSYQNAFYDVGFRSRSSAFRNFKNVTGKTPAEYFNKKRDIITN